MEIYQYIFTILSKYRYIPGCYRNIDIYSPYYRYIVIYIINISQEVAALVSCTCDECIHIYRLGHYTDIFLRYYRYAEERMAAHMLLGLREFEIGFQISISN